MANFVMYDSAGIIHRKLIVANLGGGIGDDDPAKLETKLNAAVSANTPAGMTALQVADGHDALAHPDRWKVSGGSLVRKTQVALSVQGAAAPLGPPTIAASPAIDCSVRLGGTPLALANGAATLPAFALIAGSIAKGLMLRVDPADPNYWAVPMMT